MTDSPHPELERIIFTDALVADWRPSEAPFVTATRAAQSSVRNPLQLLRDPLDRGQTTFPLCADAVEPPRGLAQLFAEHPEAQLATDTH